MSVQEPLGFEPIWHAIKGWDIQREHGAGYHGPTGDDVRHILAALTAAGYAVEQGWQDISTAPRDGTAVLLWAPDYADHPGIGRWNEIVGAWDADIGCMADGPGIMADECDGPTHWRPLPAPPAGEVK